MFLVFDDFGNVGKYDFKGLKELLISEIIEDTKQNLDGKDIILASLSLLSKLSLEPCNVNIINELKEYGWYVKDLLQLHRDMIDFKEYYISNGRISNALDTTIVIIANELKEIVKEW